MPKMLLTTFFLVYVNIISGINTVSIFYQISLDRFQNLFNQNSVIEKEVSGVMRVSGCTWCPLVGGSLDVSILGTHVDPSVCGGVLVYLVQVLTDCTNRTGCAQLNLPH